MASPHQTRMLPPQELSATFLAAVFQGQHQGYVTLYTLPDRLSTFFDMADDGWIQDTATAAGFERDSQNVYVGVGTQRSQLSQHRRGTAESVIAIPGLWADIDVRGPSHTREDLPPTFADAHKIIDALPFRPTLIVHSGYGLQPYWLFREPLEIENQEDYAAACALATTFQRYLSGVAASFGWHLDSTADLARVLRLPGTFNRKAEDAVLVRLETTDGEPRYNPSEFKDLLDIEDDPELTKQITGHETPGDYDLGAEFHLIAEQCSWLRHCVADAATLSEPEWYRAVAIAARCTDGRAIAHEISRAHPKYTQIETDKKFAQSVESSRAPRCSYVAANFDADKHCRRCKHYGRINSPVRLGFAPRVRRISDGEIQEAEPASPDDQIIDRTPEPANAHAAIERAVAGNDLKAIYDLMPEIADFTEAELAVLRTTLGTAFGKFFRVSDFNRALKEARARTTKITRLSRPDWEQSLILTNTGMPKPILANAITALRSAPEWDEVLAFDEFAMKTIATKQAPFPLGKINSGWDDDEYRRTAEWLQRREITVGPDIAWQAIEVVARERSYHPPRDYLTGLKWDGEPRIDSWLVDYLGADGNTEYLCAVGAKWLISGVARIFEPGVKADCCLILEGDPGLKKSTALDVLGGDWFTDELPDLDTKDSAMATMGVWIIEIAELSTMHRSEVGRIKAFMSRTADRFRPPYGRGMITAPRQCVFAGTVNPGGTGYLRDETGARRFWPVACTSINIERLRRDRDQLWAEAVARYRDGAEWWLGNPKLIGIAEQQQHERYEGDAWDEIISGWINKPEQRFETMGQATLPVEPFESEPGSVSVSDILLHCVGKPKGQWTQADQSRVARVLKSMGWERYRRLAGIDGSRHWAYRPGKWGRVAGD